MRERFQNKKEDGRNQQNRQDMIAKRWYASTNSRLRAIWCVNLPSLSSGWVM
jgi:hypothetical protein